jgi:hypothetical protein
MTSPSVALHKSPPAPDTFYVVKLCSLGPTSETVTVLHQVPAGAEALASFDDPNRAIDFAESTVREQQALGSPVELIDPPYGLIGTG